MGERMDRMGNESKDIAMFWRKKAAYWAQIALVLQQKKVEKTEKRREEEEKYKGMKEEEMDKDAGEEHQEESEGELKRGEDKDNSMETENELEVMKKVKDKNEDEANKNCQVRDAEDLVDEEVVKEFVEEDVAEGELGNDGGTTQYLEEVVAIVMETENELKVRKGVKDKHEDEANKDCEVGDAEDHFEEVKESVEEDEDESEGELGNDGETTQDSKEAAGTVLEERYNRESTPRRLEMVKKMDNWVHGSFYLNSGPIAFEGKRTKTFLGGG